MSADRLLWFVALGAFLHELHQGLCHWADKRMDRELERMCEAAWRP